MCERAQAQTHTNTHHHTSQQACGPSLPQRITFFSTRTRATQARVPGGLCYLGSLAQSEALTYDSGCGDFSKL